MSTICKKVGMAMPVEARAHCVWDIEKLPAITHIKVDIAPGIASHSDMIRRLGKRNAQRSGHDNASPDRQENSKDNKTLTADQSGHEKPCKQSRKHHMRVWRMEGATL